MTIDTLADVYAVCLGEALDCERELVDAPGVTTANAGRLLVAATGPEAIAAFTARGAPLPAPEAAGAGAGDGSRAPGVTP